MSSIDATSSNPVTDQTTNPPPKESTCPLIRLMKRVWNAVKKLFTNFINLFRKSPLQLSERDLKSLDKIRKRFKAPNPQELTKDLSETSFSSSISTASFSSSDSPIDDKVSVKPIEIKDPIMKKFYETSVEFIDLIIDQVIKKKINPVIPTIQNHLETLQDYMTEGADLAVSVTSSIMQPLNEKLTRFDLEKAVDADIKKLLNWLKDGQQTQDEVRVGINFHSPNQFSKEEIDICLKWLLETDHSETLLSQYVNPNKEKVTQLLNSAILVLTQFRNTEFNDKMKATLIGDDKKKLKKIIKKAIKNNAQKVTKQLLSRFIGILENISFSDAFDEIIELTVDQSNAILAANAAREAKIKADESFLKRCDAAAAMNVQQNTQDEELRLSLVQRKSEIENYGREKWVKEKGDKAALKAYKKNPICSAQIEELDLVDSPNTKPAKSPNTKPAEFPNGLKQALEIAKILLVPQNKNSEPKHLFNQSAERLIQLLLPPIQVKNKDGVIHEVDGLIYLLNQIEYPKEISKIIQEGSYIYKEILTDDRKKLVVGVLKGIKTFFYDTAEENVLNYARKEMRDGIAKGISSLFQKFIVPTRINDMMGDNALPAIQEILVEALSRQLVSSNLTKYATSFKAIIDADEKDKKEKRTELLVQLRENVDEKLNQYEIDDDSLDNLLLPFIEEKEKILEKFMKNRKPIDGEDKEKVIASALTHHSETVFHGQNSKYGELVVNLVFKMGRLSPTAEKFSGWFEGLISKELTAATHEIQKSPHYLVDIATKQIKKNYLEKEDDVKKNAVKALLFDKSKELDDDQAKATLEEQMTKTAQIAHDFVMYIANQQNFMVRPAIKAVVGGTPQHLENVISRIYHQMLGNTLYMQNFMVKAQEILSMTLKESAEKLDSTPVKIHKISRLPSLITLFQNDKITA